MVLIHSKNIKIHFMKKIALFAAIITASMTSLSNVSSAQDAKAKTILNKVSTKFKSAKSLQADFTLIVKDRTGKERTTQKGKFYMKGDQYKIDLGAQQIITDAKNIWTYMPNNKEVQVSNYIAEEQTISPAKLFSGSYEQEFNYSYSGSKTVNGKSVEVITLSPKKNQSFSKVEIQVDKATDMIIGGDIFEKTGSSYEYKISNLKINPPLSDQDFTFDTKKYPDVEVIDLR